MAQKKRPLLQKLAAIDIGSTSVRMHLVEIQLDRTATLLDQLIHPIELGADTFRFNKILPRTLNALDKVLDNFMQITREYDIEITRVVATSAIRDATNRDIIVDHLQTKNGIEIHVLDAVEEERLTFQLLTPFLTANTSKRDQRSLLLDLGGGSTEIMVLRNGSLTQGGSRRLGTSRILHACHLNECDDSRAFLECMIRNSANSTREIIGSQNFRELVVINSTLLCLFQNTKGACEIPGGLRIGTAAALRIIEQLDNMPQEIICLEKSVDLTQMQFIRPALLILREFLVMSNAKSLLLSQVDFLDGVIADMIIELDGKSPQQAFRSEIISSVFGVAEKYAVNLEHANQVARLSLLFFDSLKELLGLTEKDRLPLEIAALLHDIGRFISDRDHHKHSMYIVDWSEFVGIGESDRKLISLIARYHRKGRPSESHTEFMRFSFQDRMRISKLASLLRMADALDLSHFQHIQDIQIRREEYRLVIAAASNSDISVEKSALKKKGQLFADLTGLAPTLERLTL